MAEKKQPGDDLDFGFGGVQRHDGTAQYASTPVQDRIIGAGDEIAVPSPGDVIARAGSFAAEPPPPLPVNQATMECHRGPCMHYWVVTSRFDAQSDRINLARMRQCNCHNEPLPLAEENVFHCSQWWPATFAWMPQSLRPLLRPKLRMLWERWLRYRGYNFDWKHWKDDVFESDRPDQRALTALGMGPAAFLHDHGGGGPKVTKEGFFWE